MEAHQGEQGDRVGVAERRLLGHEPGQAHRVPAQLAADRLLAGGQVAFAKQQVERSVGRLERGRAILGARECEGRALEALSDPHHALEDGRLGGEQGPCRRRHTEAAQRSEDERELVLRAQAGMAAHEDHPELVVPDHVLAEGLPDRRGEGPLAVEVAREIGGEGAARALAPDGVDGAVAGGREQPCRRVVGDARRPHFSRAATKDAWTTSSASSRLRGPKRRVRTEISRPDSRRKTASISTSIGACGVGASGGHRTAPVECDEDGNEPNAVET